MLMSIGTFVPRLKMHVDACVYSLVIKTLKEVHEREPDRTCFRLVGSVLVERTVKDVLGTLQTTMDGVCMTTGNGDSMRE